MKKNVLMLNSVPMSLEELQMAPAMLSAAVKNRGHRFQFHDINLLLYDLCDRNRQLYDTKTEFLQSKENLRSRDPVIDLWLDTIVEKLQNVDILLVNVFSIFSQVPALRILDRCRSHDPNLKILVGGIGSHKKIFGGINQFNQSWIQQHFKDHESEIFGQLLLDNHSVDDWQSTVGMDILDRWLPQLPSLEQSRLSDFREYRLNDYEWANGVKRIPMLGSHGCVRQCSFCDVINHYPRYSFVEADTLVKEIVDTYQQTGISKINFMDSLVNGSMSNFLSMLENLVQAKSHNWLPDDFSWSGTYICRPASAQLKKIHSLLGASGADNLIIGVETGSDRIRFEMEKKFTNQDLIDELTAFQEVGVKSTLLFFPSWPTETQEDFAATLNLFSRLAPLAQANVIESVSLGSTGFSLMANTPIDDRKDEIGLTPGPISWLWKCSSNPDLDFWETLRRRMLMSQWCEYHGIRLNAEKTFRGYVYFNLREYRDMIRSYVGPAPKDLLCLDSDMTAAGDCHKLKLDIVNSCVAPVEVTFDDGIDVITHRCDPGINHVEFEFQKSYLDAKNFRFGFRFPLEHTVEWRRYENGDYYSQQGLYLDNIYLDNRDITYWGWNHLVTQDLLNACDLPDDYHQHINQRCVSQNTDLFWTVPERCGIHQHLTRILDPHEHHELLELDKKIHELVLKFAN